MTQIFGTEICLFIKPVSGHDVVVVVAYIWTTADAFLFLQQRQFSSRADSDGANMI
jgi:hypothetical protein